MNKNYMGIDQYGQTYHNLGTHPRKALLERLGKTHAAKQYTDTKSGKTLQTGYVVGRLWITLYEVTPFRKEDTR